MSWLYTMKKTDFANLKQVPLQKGWHLQLKPLAFELSLTQTANFVFPSTLWVTEIPSKMQS